MKQITIGTFTTREDAENAVSSLHKELGIEHDDISYVYKNDEGETREVNTEDVSASTAGEGAETGAVVGGTVGALAGVAAVVGVIPVVGPIFAAGPLAAALGLSGALGTTVAGALTGAAAGGLIGALVNWGVSETKAQQYADDVSAGKILVIVHHDEENREVSGALTRFNAEVDEYVVTP